jgi:hypothetical protein
VLAPKLGDWRPPCRKALGAKAGEALDCGLMLKWGSCTPAKVPKCGGCAWSWPDGKPDSTGPVWECMDAEMGKVCEVGVPESERFGAGWRGCGRPEGSLDFRLKL